MGGSLNNIHNNTSFALYLHSKAIAKLQEQASTGSRVNRASDDPTSAYQVLGLNSQKKTLENYLKNMSNVSSILDESSVIVNSISLAITNTKASLNQILSGTYDESGRQRVAGQINDTLEHIVSLANSQHMGSYIFGGTNTDTAPYAAQRSNGEITSVTYQGSLDQRNVEVAPGVQSNAYYVGNDIFSSDNRSAPIFTGDTGAAAGSGTTSVKGNAWLTVTHDGTNYNLSIGGATVDLGDAADLSNVAVTNANGEVLYVDARNITSTGTDMVTVPGTHDIFEVLISVRDLLKNEQGLSEAQLQKCRNNLSSSLDEVKNLLVGKETSMGFKIGFIEDLKNSLENIKYNAEDEATLIQEADIAQIAIDLSRREVLYQMSLSTAGRLMSMSLLDFID